MRRHTFLPLAAVCILAASSAPSILVAQSPPLIPFTGLIDVVSADPWGGVPSQDAELWHRAINADGRYVVFNSPISYLVDGDNEDWNGLNDIFLRDRMTGTTTRISRPYSGSGAGDGISQFGTISANGRHVAFASGSTNLVPGDTNDHWDVFVRDLDQQTTVRVSVATDGTQGDRDAYYPALSYDGRFVAFLSWATTFAPGVSSSSPRQIYLHDRDADADGIFDEAGGVTTELISAGFTGGIANDSVDNPRVSSDGRVLFESAATNLSAVGNPNAMNHVYVRNRLTGQTALIDRAVTGGPSQWGVGWGTSDMTDDGRFITFSSISLDIVGIATNGQSQVFLHDTVVGGTAGTTIVSKLPDGTLGDGSSYASSVSAIGRYVVFTTAASNLAWPAPGTNGSGPAMLAVRDMLDGSFTRVDQINGYEPFIDSDYYYTPAISADGTAIVLQTRSGNATQGPYGVSQVVVTTAFSAEPASASYSAAGGTGSIEVNTTAVSGWTAYSPWPWIVVTAGGDFGAGPRTVEYFVDSNGSGLARDGWIRIGSKYINIHQDGNPNGDSTPPVVTPTVTGTQVNGWYTSNVTVTWSVTDPESAIVEQYGCYSQTFTTDIITYPYCQAESDGGSSYVSFQLRRDTTGPAITINTPTASVYTAGSTVTPSFSCSDPLSGTASCTITQGSSPLDTTLGWHTFTVTATDNAGNASTRSVVYFVGTGVCVVPNDELRAHWKFENSMQDASGWIYADPTPYFNPVFTTGVSGLAWKAQPTTSSYLTAYDAGQTYQTELHTVAVWLKPTGALGQYGTIVSKEPQYRVARYPDGTLRWAFNQTTGFDWVNTGIVVPANVWTHVAVTYDNGLVKTYINGQLAHTYQLTGTRFDVTSDDYVRIGGRPDVTASYIGWMDELELYRAALSAEEIAALVQSGSGSTCLPQETTISVTVPSTVPFGQPYFATATLRDASGTPMADRLIWFNSFVGPGPGMSDFNFCYTDSNGQCSTSLDIPATAEVRTYLNGVMADFNFADDPHYLYSQDRADVTLVRGTPSITWPAPPPIVYGTALGAAHLNATANVAGTFTYSPPAGTVLGAGTHTLAVTFTPTDTLRWNGATSSTTLVVNKAAPVVTAVGGTFTYDGQPHAGSGAATGVFGEALSPVTLTYDGSSPTPPTDAGAHTVRASYAGSANYLAGQSADAALTINRATPTVTATGGTFPFDAQPHAGSGAAVGVLGEALTPVTLTYNGSPSVPINGGTYTVRASYAGSPNYTAAQSEATLTITRVTPTVEISTAPVFYTGQPRTATVVVRGVDNVQLPHIVFYDGSSINVPTNAGTYALEVQYFGSPNYEPVTATGTLVIRKATPVLGPLSDLGLTYDAQPHGGHAVQIPALEGGWLTPVIYTYNGSPTVPVNAGVYTAVVRYDGSANYEAVSSTYTLTIFKKAPQLTWGIPASLTYGQPLGAQQLNATANVPGTFTYTPPAGTIVPAGEPLLTATFTPADATNYEVVSATRSVTVAKANPQLAWPNPGNLVYGTLLTGAQLNATANTPGTFVYNPPVGTLLAAGQHFLSVTFTPDDLANYNTGANLGWSITVAKATPVVSWDTPADIVYGTALGAAQLNATANVPGTFTYSPAAGTVLDAGTRPLWVTFTPTDPANYNSLNATVILNVTRAPSTINWSNPADIVYRTALGAAQLNATANVPGYYSYSPFAGTVLNAGSHTLSVTFTPWDSNHDGSTASVTLNVAKYGTTLIWQPVAGLTYGAGLGVAQLNASAVGVDGTMSYSPPAGTVLPAGVHTLSVTFTPNDPANYNGASATALTEVYRAASTISWSNPAAVDYGTALGGAQLNATANVPGTFSYSPAPGTVLNAGWHTLSVTFTPDDAANYVDATKSVTLQVRKAASTIAWPNPADIVYGTALGGSQLNATANVPGTFSYSPVSGTVLNTGSHTLSATFTPSDAANYNGASANVSLTVTRAASTVSWSNPADIVYGTALGGSQLNATANVPGTLTYSPATGTVLTAGSHTLSVTFTPDDAANYDGASANVSIAVGKAASTISWSNPANIVYGTALGGSELNATANVPGTFAYSPATGTVLNAGSHALSVTFTPDDAANYDGASANVSIVVGKAASVITWANPAGITYGTALSGTQLNATANVNGSFVYSPAAGTVLGAGTQSLTVVFTPDDSANYLGATGDVSIVVAKAASVITWANPAGITYGTALSGTQLNATANVTGSFAYSPASGTVLGAGTQSLAVTFTPDDSANYASATANVSIEVAKAVPVMTWANPAAINYGTALSGTQLNATASVAGSFAYSPAGGSVLNAGTQNLSVTFTPADAANYTSASAAASIVIAPVALTVSTNDASKVYGEALPSFTASGTGFVNDDSMASLGGTLVFATSATATSAPGSYAVTPSGVSSSNYSITFAAGTLTVTKAATSLTLTTTPNPSNHNQTVQLRAVVAAIAPGAGTATGTIEFRENGTLLGTATLVNGVATMNKSFKRGTHSLTATYAGNTNFTGSSGSVTHQTQ